MSYIKNKIIAFFKLLFSERKTLIISVISGFLFSGCFLLASSETLFFIDSTRSVDLVWLISGTVAMTAILFTICIVFPKFTEYSLILALFFLSLLAANRSLGAHFYLLFLLIGVLTLLIMSFKTVRPERLIISHGAVLYGIIALVTVTIIIVVSYGCILRYRGYVASTFDFGLFVQMFESMATDFSQNTTLERNQLLSHFAVHFSPIYYLLLPFYMIFRSPEFLLVAQATICFSLVIPVVLLCRKWHYSGFSTLLISIVAVFFPAFTGACFYDFHENAFLPALVLWALYFLEKKGKSGVVGLFISALLILCVKEDAGIYVITLGIYALLRRKKNRLVVGLPLLAFGIVGFIGATSFIEAMGEGIKVSRYNTYLVDGQDSLVDVVINVLKNPIFFLSNLLNEKKILFTLQMLVPLLFIPVRSRRLADWSLFLPFLLVNLASDYVYQTQINYQYIFASGAFLVFLFVKNIRYFKEKSRGKILLAASLSAVILFCGNTSRLLNYNVKNVQENAVAIQQTDELLSTLPRDSTILSTTYFTPHLADCKDIYMFPVNRDIDPDFVILDTRPGRLVEFQDVRGEYEKKGYTIYGNQGFVIILQKP